MVSHDDPQIWLDAQQRWEESQQRAREELLEQARKRPELRAVLPDVPRGVEETYIKDSSGKWVPEFTHTPTSALRRLYQDEESVRERAAWESARQAFHRDFVVEVALLIDLVPGPAPNEPWDEWARHELQAEGYVRGIYTVRDTAISRGYLVGDITIENKSTKAWPLAGFQALLIRRGDRVQWRAYPFRGGPMDMRPGWQLSSAFEIPLTVIWEGTPERWSYTEPFRKLMNDCWIDDLD